MISGNDNLTDVIGQAAAALLAKRPAYKPMLLFYKDLFVHQEAARRQCQPPELHLEKDLIRLKHKENFPLIRMDEFRIDTACSANLLQTVCEIIQRHETGLSDCAAAILQAGPDRVDIGRLSRAVLETDDPAIQRAAERLNIDSRSLAFVIYASIRPCLVKYARHLAAQLPEGTTWINGYCPVCGSYPALAVLDEEGRQNLHCQFCWQAWTVKRLFCAFCNNADSKQQRYFYSETESNLRVNVCDKCGTYLKVVDLRKTDYPLYPPLEQVSTLHLDIKAREEGYHSGIETAAEDVNDLVS
jgi:FdhE protein